RQRDPDVGPVLSGLLDDRGQIFEPDGRVIGRGANSILRPPARIADEVAEPHRAGVWPGLVDDDYRIPFSSAPATRQLGELFAGELGRLGVGLLPLAEIELSLGARGSGLHDELAEGQNWLAVEPALRRQPVEGRTGE